MQGKKQYPPSWIDEEGFGKRTYKVLRELVVKFQSKNELIRILTESSVLKDLKLSKSVMKEIDGWLAKNDAAVLRKENAALQARLRTFTTIPPPPPPPKVDNERFTAFKRELDELCRSHGVYIYYDWDGYICVESCDYENETNVEISLVNEIILKEKE